MRSEPSDKSEMTNQILFGELVEVQEQSENQKWLKVKTLFDNYQGWVDILQLHPVSEDYAQSYQTIRHKVLPYHTVLTYQNQQILAIAGSSLPFWDGKEGQINGQRFTIAHYEEKVYSSAQDIVDLAMSYHITTPYLWGGRTPFGIDCSGFVQSVFKILGKDIPRDCYQQEALGTEIPLAEALPGDIAFFVRDERIVHVGIVLHEESKIKVIHARGCVRIDPLDETGILDEEVGTYSHHLYNIKRINI